MSETNLSAAHLDQPDHILHSDTAFLSGEGGLNNIPGSTQVPSSPTEGDTHDVQWTLNIALAVPPGKDAETPEAVEKATKSNSRTSVGKSHKAQSCYHIEWQVLPGDTVKMDLILFGPVAKVYKENEIKMVRTWHEGDKQWVGWSQDIRVRVSRDVVIRLLQEKVRLKISNGSKELSSQASYQRLRAVRVSQELLDNAADVCGEVETMVRGMRRLCEKKCSKSTEHKTELKFHFESEMRSRADKSLAQAVLSQDSDPDVVRKTGSTCVEISPVGLVVGETSLNECFQVGCAGVFEVLCSITLDKQLLSEQLKVELNPLVITVISATSMPSSPVPFDILQCMPVYCQYKFHDSKVHRTNFQKQATKIYFRDVNVILTGLKSSAELQEFLCGPPLEIEVHDRDIKLEKALETTLDTPPINPFGVASLDLSDLLTGKRSIKVHLPIKCCSQAPLLEREHHAERRTTDRTVSRGPLPQGHYYDANSQLKVKVEIASPLSVKENCSHGPFGRIIYLFGCRNLPVLSKLRRQILQTNVAAFRLSAKNTETALSNYILEFEHPESTDLDFLTGFHVLDERTHIVVLEGLKQQAVRRLWESVPMKLSGNEDEQVTVLYNSKLAFFKRIYGSLDVSLTPICLHQPLETIVKNPLIYVRGMVSQACLQAVSRLSQLCGAKLLSDAVQHHLFPSAAMVVSLKSQYGIDAEPWEEMPRASHEQGVVSLPPGTKTHSPPRTYNMEYIKWKHNSQSCKDFIQINIRKVQEESERLKKTKVAQPRVELAGAAASHIYSIQTFNSNVLAKELLWSEMAKFPERRFTYSQQYHSATVAPGEVTSKTSTDSAARAPAWSTSMDECWLHPRQPDQARVEELRKPWRENILHANLLSCNPCRERWTWSQRSEDFELYRKPPTFFSIPPGDALQREPLQTDGAQCAHRLQRLLLPDAGPSSNCS
ncbi:uncharacterized protein FLJ43738 isoform X2 [Fundulus heteroclitus]|uniref:uncharacterized protein FLJ43738 isoform X2 n=1 Tax=Fundulus heteroclitus TaxID=8078 RepID=UPI00165C9958|nr:uncharacterized protein FLJ43738 isoform X2 [Fundulus heteroclitus]